MPEVCFRQGPQEAAAPAFNPNPIVSPSCGKLSKGPEPASARRNLCLSVRNVHGAPDDHKDFFLRGRKPTSRQRAHRKRPRVRLASWAWLQGSAGNAEGGKLGLHSPDSTSEVFECLVLRNLDGSEAGNDDDIVRPKVEGPPQTQSHTLTIGYSVIGLRAWCSHLGWRDRISWEHDSSIPNRFCVAGDFALVSLICKSCAQPRQHRSCVALPEIDTPHTSYSSVCEQEPTALKGRNANSPCVEKSPTSGIRGPELQDIATAP